SLRAVLAAPVAAWSMSHSALASFAVTPAGRVCPAHSGPDWATANVQRAVVQGKVVVVVVGASVVVVLAVAEVGGVDVGAVVVVVVVGVVGVVVVEVVLVAVVAVVDVVLVVAGA